MPNHKALKVELSGTLRLMEALSAPLRFELLVLLRRRGPLGLADLTEALKERRASPTNVFGHLEILEGLGLVKRHREGRSITFSLEEGTGRLLDGLRRLIGRDVSGGGK